MKRHSRGFTLADLASVTMVVGLPLGRMLLTMSTQLDQRKRNETQQTLDLARDALIGYVIANGRLPWAGDVSMSPLYYYAADRRYRDVTDNLSGRLAYRISRSDFATNNALTSNTELGYSGILIFTSGSYCSYMPEEEIWYDNWKDQLFYAIANEYSPSASQPTANCTNSTWLKINGSATYYAAAVIFAGEKLSFQNRNTLSDKSQISNYLEGRNASNHPYISGNGNYEGAKADSASNDFGYAIDTSLAVSCYDAGSGTMMAAPSTACP